MWHTYNNGNMKIYINDSDGTRECFTLDDDFRPEFPLNIDVHTSYKCSYGCPQCYAGCTKDGSHADLFSYKFIETLHPYTELALNINSELPPRFEEFLYYLHEKSIFTNVTVNQRFLEKNYHLIDDLYKNKLIWGLGVSLMEPTEEFIQLVKKYPNAVIHTINGILKPSDYEALRGNGLKILILGYKMKNRGKEYFGTNNEQIMSNQKWLYNALPDMVASDDFKVISLDCLGAEQLEMKRLLSEEEYNTLFQGEDGTLTFAIDMVKGTFSSSSTSEIEYPIMDDVREMFEVVKKEVTNEQGATV